MKLVSISTQPNELFPAVEFDSGLNFIYGIRDLPGDSLNCIGKSLFLDFIDFGLLGYFSPQHNSRLSRAYNKKLLKNCSVNLKFEVDDIIYTIVRSFENHTKASLFSEKIKIKDKYVGHLTKNLFDIIFIRKSYKGHYEDNWFTKLISFYLKIQKVSEEKFINPVKFTKGSNAEIILYHFFLLNFDNTLFYKLNNLASEISAYDKSKDKTKEFLLENHKLENISAAHNTIDKLKYKIRRKQKAIDNYHLGEQYDTLSAKADELTSQIKNLILKNSIDNKKILEYDQFIKGSPRFSTERVKNIYDEINPVLGSFIKNTLDDAIHFRNSISQSRVEFLKNLKEKLQLRVSNRIEQIKKLEEEQSNIIRSLSSNNTLNDIKGTYATISQLNSEKSDLESQLALYEDLVKKKNTLVNEIGIHRNAIDTFISDNGELFTEFGSIMSDIYDSIFDTLGESPVFSINKNDKDYVELRILPDDIYSHGRNQGRTLVYDLALLFNAIQQNLNSPRFIIHDGIFDSLDNTHLAALYSYCSKKLKEGYDFQYIVTLNQIGDGNKDDILNHKKVSDMAKLKLSQNNKLLGKDF
ncbi:MAG: DUF2326 domain-containing protein [Melioribacteraceae bacterium]|nr:DUF2326 domain-containing protein [Melioribacteraceae bacterium]MCF8353909.1 DUF2326 domain-containing protein [Melioribacteraceae bacterium]MCF8392666.1 DUF2326 domain-containing protein [Melioribacteraceae bacterium]MCF8417687.1 DUF2326 domain-containing protein [Melioribacteraceae bacterium]